MFLFYFMKAPSSIYIIAYIPYYFKLFAEVFADYRQITQREVALDDKGDKK